MSPSSGDAISPSPPASGVPPPRLLGSSCARSSSGSSPSGRASVMNRGSVLCNSVSSETSVRDSTARVVRPPRPRSPQGGPEQQLLLARPHSAQEEEDSDAVGGGEAGRTERGFGRGDEEERGRGSCEALAEGQGHGRGEEEHVARNLEPELSAAEEEENRGKRRETTLDEEAAKEPTALLELQHLREHQRQFVPNSTSPQVSGLSPSEPLYPPDMFSPTEPAAGGAPVRSEPSPPRPLLHHVPDRPPPFSSFPVYSGWDLGPPAKTLEEPPLLAEDLCAALLVEGRARQVFTRQPLC